MSINNNGANATAFLNQDELEMLAEQEKQNKKPKGGNGFNGQRPAVETPAEPQYTAANEQPPAVEMPQDLMSPEEAAEEARKQAEKEMREAQGNNLSALQIRAEDIKKGLKASEIEGSMLALAETQKFVGTYARKSLENAEIASEGMEKLRDVRATVYKTLTEVKVEEVEDKKGFLSDFGDLDLEKLIGSGASEQASLPGSPSAE